MFVNPFNTLERNDIFTLVTENRVYLEAYIEHGDFLELLEIDEIQSVRSFGDTIEFACGGSGLGSATFYCGFYYSENDDLYGIWCAPTEGSSLTPVDGGFLYEEAKGDNRYYTEHICGHFYYYEAAF